MLERSERRQGFSGDRQEGGVSPSENVAFVDSEERNEDIAQVGDRHLRQISCLSQYLNEIGQIPRLSVSEEQQVAREVRSGSEEARERMINGNLRLVVKIAHDFEGYGMPVSDLINEGNIGLMKAVEHFDPERGVRFSTYSAYCGQRQLFFPTSDN